MHFDHYRPEEDEAAMIRDADYDRIWAEYEREVAAARTALVAAERAARARRDAALAAATPARKETKP